MIDAKPASGIFSVAVKSWHKRIILTFRIVSWTAVIFAVSAVLFWEGDKVRLIVRTYAPSEGVIPPESIIWSVGCFWLVVTIGLSALMARGTTLRSSAAAICLGSLLGIVWLLAGTNSVEWQRRSERVFNLEGVLRERPQTLDANDQKIATQQARALIEARDDLEKIERNGAITSGLGVLWFVIGAFAVFCILSAIIVTIAPARAQWLTDSKDDYPPDPEPGSVEAGMLRFRHERSASSGSANSQTGKDLP